MRQTPAATHPLLRPLRLLSLSQRRRIAQDPELWAGAAPGQLQLNLLERPRAARNAEEGHDFDPTGLRVRRIQGAGSGTLVRTFLQRYHYLESRGPQGPMFVLSREDADEPLGVATFARTMNGAWARSTIQPLPEDDPEAPPHALVRESEYLELSRLALVPDEVAPLGSGAASWFVAQALAYFRVRNRLIWRARAKQTLGIDLSKGEARLLGRARLGEANRGTGFIKTIVSFADPMAGHRGTVYQALGFRYGGQQDSQRLLIGPRSRTPVSKRRIQKARNPEADGHLTSALRLIWEGAPGRVRLHGDRDLDLAWLKDIRKPGVDRKIRSGLTDALRAAGEERVQAVAEVDHQALERISAPGKHRYLLFLGSDHWAREVARRCRHVRDQILREEQLWESRSWGSRPDIRHRFYPDSP